MSAIFNRVGSWLLIGNHIIQLHHYLASTLDSKQGFFIYYYLFTLHISISHYKHICLCLGHRHMCLYPFDIYKSVTKSIGFITVFLLILSQTMLAQATLFIKLWLLSPWRVWNREFRAKFTQTFKILDVKFRYFCLVLSTYHTVASF